MPQERSSMNFRHNKLAVIVSFVLFLFLVSFAVASTPEPPAVPRDYVVDLAGVINDDTKSQLNALLHELEQKTTAQVLVLTVQSLDGEEIRSFGLKIAEKWKLGQKGKDIGALLIVAVKDRKYTIEVGYGLEGVLPDSLVGTIGREYLVPYFRKGDYGSGIAAATLAIIQTIAASESVQISGMPVLSRPRTVSANRPPGIFQMVLFGILGLAALILFITHPRQCLLVVLASQIGSGRGGWSGGGGGFGGSGGGFGGGGGGGFGGGGASGGW
jgi:uncharacterized protein